MTTVPAYARTVNHPRGEAPTDTRVTAVQVFIDAPAETAGALRTFWSEVTGWPVAWPWDDHPELSTFTPPSGTSGVSVQDAEVAPRVHLDLYPTGDPDLLVGHVVGQGARLVQRHAWWTVLESPGGLPLCVVNEPAGDPPPATTWPEGHRSRVVQVCVDIPEASWRAEVAFWQAVLGWHPTPHTRSEYSGFDAPQSSPLRVLLQRLGTADTSATVLAHLDLGTDNLEAEVERLVRVGAGKQSQPVGGAGWVVLSDPAGMSFCVTARRP